MINKISPTNTNFKAELWPYPHTCPDKEIGQMFREQTKDFPEYILMQDDISFAEKDFFVLFKKNRNQSVARGWYEFTSNHLNTKKTIVNRFVEIFNSLIKMR